MRNLKTLRKISDTARSMIDHLHDESCRPPESISGDESSDKEDVIDTAGDLVDKKQEIIADLVEQREILMQTSEELKRSNDELQKQLYAQKEENEKLAEANRRLVRELEEMTSATGNNSTAIGTPLHGVTPKAAEQEGFSMLMGGNFMKDRSSIGTDDDSANSRTRTWLRTTPRESNTAKAAPRDERIESKHLLATQLRFSQLEQREARSQGASKGSRRPSMESTSLAPSACSRAGVTQNADTSRGPRERTAPSSHSNQRSTLRDTRAGQSLPKAQTPGQPVYDAATGDGRTKPHSKRSSAHDFRASHDGRTSIKAKSDAKTKASAGPPSRERSGTTVSTSVRRPKDAPNAQPLEATNASDTQVRASKNTAGYRNTKSAGDLKNVDALELSSSKAMLRKPARQNSDVIDAAELSAALKSGDARWGRLLGNVKM